MLRGVVLFLAAGGLLAQTGPLERLKSDVAASRGLALEKADGAAAKIHRVLRDWIESRLPGDRGLLQIDMPRAEAVMRSELKGAQLLEEDAPTPADDDYEGPGFGYVEVAFQQLPELPNTLLVTAGVSIPCGVDEAVYLYQFDATSRARVVDDSASNSFGYGDVHVELSGPDGQGRRLLLVQRRSVQCQSTWMAMTYSVYRFGLSPGIPERLLAAQHGYWLGNDGPEFDLTPDRLAVEFLDSSVDASVHNRTHVLRYDFTEGVRRIDPVAFQAQDFAEEWLTRPWEEMESRSMAGTKDMYQQLHADYVSAEYDSVAPCAARPGRWLIALEISDVGERKLDKPQRAYFLVRELGKYRYQMEAVSNTKPAGCPGKGVPSDLHPWVAAEEIRGIR